jgi:hypothetical protein
MSAMPGIADRLITCSQLPIHQLAVITTGLGASSANPVLQFLWLLAAAIGALIYLSPPNAARTGHGSGGGRGGGGGGTDPKGRGPGPPTGLSRS